MKPGFTTYAFAWSIGVPGWTPPTPYSAFDVLRRVHELRGQVLQVCDNQPLTRLAPGELDRYQKLAEDWGIAIELGTRGLLSEDLERCLSLARRFGSRLVRLVIDSPGHEPSPNEVLGLLAPRLPAFADAGILLAIENHDRFPAPVLADLVSQLGTDRVGVALDTANSFGALEGPEVVVDVLAPLTCSLHLKDFVVRRVPSNMGFVIRGAPLGAGRLDVPALLRRIRDAAGHVNALIELWPPFEGDLAKTLEVERAWAEQSAQYLLSLLDPNPPLAR